MLTSAQRKGLLESFLFQGVEKGWAVEFVSRLSPVPFPKGDCVYSAHSFRRSIGFVLSGELAVTKGENLLLNRLGKGACFGVAALFNPAERYVTTITAQKASQVVFITAEELEGLFAAQPVTAVNYITFLSQRIQFLNRKIDTFTAPTAEVGLAIYLLTHEEGGMVKVSEGFAKLAKELGMGRASLYRSLDQLGEAGVLTRSQREIIINDLGALAALCPNR